MKALDNQIGPVTRPSRMSMDALTDTGRFGCDLWNHGTFISRRKQLADLEKNDQNFNRRAYLQWLSDCGLSENISNRFKFAAMVRSEARTKRNIDQ